jgi:hypothetical protein
MYIIGEIVQVKIGTRWYDAEIKDITSFVAFVHIYALNIKRNVPLTSVRS